MLNINKSSRYNFLLVEKLTLAYIAATAAWVLLFAGRDDHLAQHLLARAVVASVIFSLAWFDGRLRSTTTLQTPNSKLQTIRIVRLLLPFLLLSYWYPETGSMNNFLSKDLDDIFINLDEQVFGCQPSLLFSEWMPERWFSELMYFGYFSYYFIFFGTAVWCWFRRPELVERAICLFVGSFYCFYLIFIVLPVVGPQFFLAPPANAVPDGYFFCRLMRFLQSMGEQPTGAFPSSHVGITFIVLLFIIRSCRSLLRYALPLFVILTLSTVYIKAHYLIDVVGGFLFGGFFFYMWNKILDKLLDCQLNKQG